VAKSLTAVGLRRVSIGPPIIVSVARNRLAGRGHERTAASTGTVGWHTEIACDFARPRDAMNSRTYAT
jgi:hypothetical protein